MCVEKHQTVVRTKSIVTGSIEDLILKISVRFAVKVLICQSRFQHLAVIVNTQLSSQ